MQKCLVYVDTEAKLTSLTIHKHTESIKTITNGSRVGRVFQGLRIGIMLIVFV